MRRTILAGVTAAALALGGTGLLAQPAAAASPEPMAITAHEPTAVTAHGPWAITAEACIRGGGTVVDINAQFALCIGGVFHGKLIIRF
jgi:hypothetical protein